MKLHVLRRALQSVETRDRAIAPNWRDILLEVILAMEEIDTRLQLLEGGSAKSDRPVRRSIWEDEA